MTVKPIGPFRKSSFSGANGNCVEVAPAEDGVLVRNSKRPDGAVVHFNQDEWSAFVAGVKAREFDNIA